MADSPASNTVSPPIGAIAHYNLLARLFRLIEANLPVPVICTERGTHGSDVR